MPESLDFRAGSRWAANRAEVRLARSAPTELSGWNVCCWGDGSDRRVGHHGSAPAASGGQQVLDLPLAG